MQWWNEEIIAELYSDKIVLMAFKLDSVIYLPSVQEKIAFAYLLYELRLEIS